MRKLLIILAFIGLIGVFIVGCVYYAALDTWYEGNNEAAVYITAGI